MYRDQSQRDFARELRNHATPAETRLWHFLKAEKLGVKFRRQAAIGPYIVDFVCFSNRLIIELDGHSFSTMKPKITTPAVPLGWLHAVSQWFDFAIKCSMKKFSS
jgi:very-short-patch-repair endonuclease